MPPISEMLPLQGHTYNTCERLSFHLPPDQKMRSRYDHQQPPCRVANARFDHHRRPSAVHRSGFSTHCALIRIADKIRAELDRQGEWV